MVGSFRLLQRSTRVFPDYGRVTIANNKRDNGCTIQPLKGFTIKRKNVNTSWNRIPKEFSPSYWLSRRGCDFLTTLSDIEPYHRVALRSNGGKKLETTFQLFKAIFFPLQCRSKEEDYSCFSFGLDWTNRNRQLFEMAFFILH